ncbi:hypothetical protein SDC9_118356 [bioreactor metagenome]|uniref:Uncharacterized protein n=1 Tax=bioreactor metagenome TaxID=1076179 RepID=A0A645C362_9ZZZZ
MHGEQQRFVLVGQQLAVRQRAGRDHAHHLALHRPLGRAHLAHLLGNRHRFAHLDEATQIVLQRVKGHPRHDDRLARRLPTLRERDIQQPRGLLGIRVEQLVKIAHAIEEQGVGVLCLQCQVLRHHGGMRA